ncbi:laccase domain-containing protein, partial [Serratia marcescens]
MNSLILPDWPLPPGVKACSTTRGGGTSLPPYDSLNLGTHVGDEEQAVKRNRERLVTVAGLPQMPVWLEQVHGTRVVTLTGHPPA